MAKEVKTPVVGEPSNENSKSKLEKSPLTEIPTRSKIPPIDISTIRRKRGPVTSSASPPEGVLERVKRIKSEKEAKDAKTASAVVVETPVLVDPDYAYNAAIESTPSLIHSLLECFANCKDYGQEVHIYLHGDWVDGNRLRLKKIVFEDDGCGMSHDIVCERFRGSYFDSASHGTHEKSGRNGVGVKTNFKYWQTIEVETTTGDLVPEWDCCDDNRPGIQASWDAVSKLKAGQPDTEKRFYRLTRNEMKFLKVVDVTAGERGSRVVLKDPIGSVKLDFAEFKSRISHSIEFLDADRHPDHKVVLHSPKRSGDSMERVTMRPFHEHLKIGHVMCEAASTVDDDKNVTWVSCSGHPSISVEGPDPKVLGDVEIFIKVLEKVEDHNNQFVMSICGSNVYDEVNKGGRSFALTKASNDQSLTSEVSFFNRIFGYVRTNDPRLKKALRLNRTALDDDDPVVQEFLDYLGRVFRVLNRQYLKSVEVSVDTENANALSQIKHRLNMVLSSGKGERDDDGDSHKPGVTANHWWTCLDCEKDWRAPMKKTLTHCHEHDVEGKKGCGSGRIERKRNRKSSHIDIIWVKYLGDFVSARYDEKTNRVELAQYHPDFILRGTSKTAKEERVTRGV
jgi:hypothetical protein